MSPHASSQPVLGWTCRDLSVPNTALWYGCGSVRPRVSHGRSLRCQCPLQVWFPRLPPSRRLRVVLSTPLEFRDIRECHKPIATANSGPVPTASPPDPSRRSSNTNQGRTVLTAPPLPGPRDGFPTNVKGSSSLSRTNVPERPAATARVGIGGSEPEAPF